MKNTELESSTKGSAKAGKAAAHGAKATYKGTLATGKIATTFPFLTLIIVIVISVILFLSILVTMVSQTELNEVFHLTPLGENGYNKPLTKEEEEDSIWNKDAIIKENSELFAIISEEKESSHSQIMSQIASDCAANGWDQERTFSHLKEEDSIGFIPEVQPEPNKKPETNTSGGKGTIIKDFPLTGLTSSQKSTFRWEDIDQNWNRGTVQRKLYDSGKWYVDQYGLCKFKNDDGTEDYMCAMGSYFGETGNRYKVTFNNGTVATFLKFDAKADKHTEGNNGMAGIAGDVIEFMVNTNKLHPTIRYSGNVAYHPEKIFGEITKVELIEGTISTNIMKGFSNSDSLFLATFSVAMDNLQYTKEKDGSERYKNNRGDFMFLSWLKEKPGDVDVHKELRKRLQKYKNSGKSFYEYSYEKNPDGSIKIYTDYIEEIVKEKRIKKVKNKKTGKMEKKEIEVEVIKKKPVYYTIPTIKELDLNSIAEDVFDVDPNAKYVNGDKSGVTNREVISTMSKATSSLLFGTNSSIDGPIINSQFTGKYSWPIPGMYIITSPFGFRVHPITGAWIGHNGVDISGAGASGTPVVAAEEGVVILARWNGGYGNCIDIKHPDGNITRYGHLGAIQVQEGQKVKKAQLIGLCGNTGNSTGPHLHFEVQVNGMPVEPLSFICSNDEAKDLITGN